MRRMSKYILLRDQLVQVDVNSCRPLCLSESGSDYSGGEDNEEEFDELDHREDGQFWATNDDPVERAESPGYEPYESGDEQSTPEPVISLFAIGKLSR